MMWFITAITSSLYMSCILLLNLRNRYVGEIMYGLHSMVLGYFTVMPLLMLTFVVYCYWGVFYGEL